MAVEMQAVLKRQYHAALATLRATIEPCPEALWTEDGWATPYWQVAYHALFYTHLYLQPSESDFTPWQRHREEYQFLGSVPWPPHHAPRLDAPYTKEDVLAYWDVCDAMIDDGVDRLDLAAEECGFWWYSVSKLDHQLVNIRHIQHHAAQLAERLRQRTGQDVPWVAARP